jgi:hypothetical protein
MTLDWLETVSAVEWRLETRGKADVNVGQKFSVALRLIS